MKNNNLINFKHLTKHNARFFLAKSEPESYSIEDLEKEAITWWDGVRNYTAIIVIKSWKIGDYVFFYRSVRTPAIVGIMKVISLPIFDTNDERGISWKAQLELVAKFDRELTLKEIKASGLFNDFMLVRNSRLSTMACNTEFVNYVLDRVNYKYTLDQSKKINKKRAIS